MPYDPERHGPHRIVGPGFHEKVYEIVEQIPEGRVATYGDVGRALGSRRIARHVGYALAALKGRNVPWHRVVNGRGRISFTGSDPRSVTQRRILRHEGVVVEEGGRVRDFVRLRYDLGGD